MPSGLRLWNEGDVKPLLLRESVTFYFIFVSAQKHWDSFKKKKITPGNWQFSIYQLLLFKMARVKQNQAVKHWDVIGEHKLRQKH